MKHSFIDRYSDRHSFIHRLDPRVKFLTSLAFIITVMLTPPTGWTAFALYLAIILTLVMASRVPLPYVLGRSLAILPFVAMVVLFVPFLGQGQVAGSFNAGTWRATGESPLLIAAGIVARSWLCMLSLVLLTATTRVADLLRGLGQLGMPRVLTVTLSFMYRYIFVLTDEAMRLRQARDSRCSRRASVHQLKTVGNMIGTLFVRSYERAERVYAAMLSRGYDGEAAIPHHPGFKPADAAFAAALVTALVVVRLTAAG